VAGGGGILINPEGTIEFRYAWGLGQKTNNQAKADGMLLGLILAQRNGIKKMQVLGDSMIIIRHMINTSKAKITNLNQIIKIAQNLLPAFESVSFYHVMRGNNQEVDRQANKGCHLEEEKSVINDVVGMTNIP